MWSATKLLPFWAALLVLTHAQIQNPEARCGRVSFAFFANEDDCGRFVFCNDGETLDIECRANEIWRQEQASCVLGNRDTCTVWDPVDACVGLANGPIEYPGYCERYIECVYERADVQYCPVGLIFSEMDQRCVIGSAGACESYEHLCVSGPYSRFRHPEHCGKFIQCYNQTAVLEDCEEMEVFQPSVGNCVAGDGCAALPVNEVCDGRFNGLVAHPEECKSYIECYEGGQQVLSCPEGEIFRDGVCVPGTTTTCQTVDGLCANRAQVELQHPDSCVLYIECFGGNAAVGSCPIGKIFRPDMQFCIPGDSETCVATPIDDMCINSPYGVIFPHPDDCSKLIQCNGTHAVEYSCPDDHIVQPGSLDCAPGLTETCQFFDEICIGKFDNRIPHPQCDQFVHCQNERAFVLTCAPGEIFSESDQRCVTGDINLCEALSCFSRPDGTYPHPSLCYSFYQCSNHQISTQMCPLDHIFDPLWRVCTPGTIESCQPLPFETMCNDTFNGVRYPLPSNDGCEQFVICTDEEASVGTCPAGTVLRTQFFDCVAGDAADCEVFDVDCAEVEETVQPHPTRCDVKIVCVNGTVTVESCPPGEILNWETLECTVGGIDDCFPVVNVCEGREDGLVEDPSSCGRYVRCSLGQITVLDCPANTVFEEVLQQCVPGDSEACTNICTGQENELMLSNPESCGDYFRCSEELPLAESCEIGNIFVGTTCVPGSNTCEDFSDRCVGEPDGPIAFPDQCGLFLECSNEEASTESCPQETTFVAELRQCVPGDAVTCANICSEQENDLLLPNMESCTDYYRCTEGLPIAESCDPDHIFMESTASCTPGSTDSCEDFSVLCTGQPDGSLPFPDSTRCGQFLECSTESASVGTCPPDTVFIPELTQCLPGDVATCANICTDQADNILLANRESCADYYRCTEGIPIVESCEDDNIFDETSASCVPGSVDGCEDFSERCIGAPDGLLAFPDASRCSQFLACAVESVSVGSCPEEQIFSEATQLCVPGDVEQCIEDGEFSFCGELEDGSYEHPQICYLFVGCQDGIAQVGACGSDEIFNVELGSCATGDRSSC